MSNWSRFLLTNAFLYYPKRPAYIQIHFPFIKDEVEEWKRPEDFNKAALEARHLIEMADEDQVRKKFFVQA